MTKCKYHTAFLRRSLRPEFPKTPAYPKTISSEILFLKLSTNENILTIHADTKYYSIPILRKGKNAQILANRIIQGILPHITSHHKLYKPSSLVLYLF
jgi:hypothetical protein